MRRAVLIGFLLFIPVSAFAAGLTWQGPLVPACAYTPGPPCQACDFVALVHNVLVFFVYVGGMAAVLMFAYAGILYVTAPANKNNLDEAKKIFWNALIGLILIIAAWLIVDLIIRTFNGQSLDLFTDIKCVTVAQVNGGFTFTPNNNTQSAAQTNPNQQAVPGERLSHDDALAQLKSCGYTVTSTSGTGGVYAGCQTDGCTSLQGMRTDTTAAACGVAAACGSACKDQMLVTGGTECFAHGTKSSISHCNGYKVDIDDTTAMNAFMNNPNNTFFKKVTTGFTRSGLPEWKDKCGNSIIKEADHYDYQVSTPCVY